MQKRTPPSALPRFFHLAVISVTASFVFLLVRFSIHVFGDLSHQALRLTLIGIILWVALLILALIAFVLCYQLYSSARESRSEAAVTRAKATWIGLLHASIEPMPIPRSAAAVEAWLRLREGGEVEEQRLLELGRELGVEATLIRRLGSRLRTRRLAAIEDLSRARILPGVLPLLARAASTDQAERHASLRAAARTIAAASEPDREALLEPFVEAVASASLPTIPLEEILLVLGEGAPPVVRALLERQELSVGHLRAALAAARHLVPKVSSEAIASLALHPNPEVRAAALQTLAAFEGALEPEAAKAVRDGLEDERDFLRVHAARAAGRLPESEALRLLWETLGDASWWVRLASAQTLASLGGAGLARLAEAASEHPDGFARDMARDHEAELEWKAA